MHISLAYLLYCLIGKNRVLKSFLFLASYALSCVVAIGYWYMYSIKPSLVDSTTYASYDLDYFVNMFIHGGNVIALTWHTYNFTEFKPIKISTMLISDTIFISTYVLIQKVSRHITGRGVYEFLDELDYFQLFLFYFSLFLIGVTIKMIILRFIYQRKNVKLN